jgi:3-oxoacyl-[acyl-carrier protein] reductase
MTDLEGRVVIVTGGSGGIGRAYCHALAEAGCAVVVADIKGADSVAESIMDAGGKALAVALDVADQASADAMAKRVDDTFGRVDALINNAAFYLGVTQGPFEDIPPDEWDRAFTVNVRGPWTCAKALYPYMAARGVGRIINVSSTTVWDGTPGFLHYVATKSAMLGFSRALAREVGRAGIRVNTVTPDYTPHDATFVATQPVGLDTVLSDRRCFQRTQLPQDMVPVVLFLCGPGSDAVTGQNFLVNGGGVFQ